MYITIHIRGDEPQGEAFLAALESEGLRDTVHITTGPPQLQFGQERIGDLVASS